MNGMSMPGFTAEASLLAKTLPRMPYVGRIIHGLSSCAVEPTAAGATEQEYMDCVVDCRTAARLHQISDVNKCIRDCAAGRSGTGSSSNTSGGSSSAPAALCLAGSVLVTCPDGFVGCCPSSFSVCTILPFLGRWCI
jgi:hypothetical protein